MKPIQISLLFVLSLVNTLSFAEILVKPGVNISDRLRLIPQNLGVVKGFHSCGGSAQVLQWRYETCLDTDTICHVPADGVSRISQVDFIASSDIDALGLRLVVNSSDGTVNDVIDQGPIESLVALKKGHSYTNTAIGGVTEKLKGKDAVFQYILYNVNNNQVEVCAEAYLQYV